MLKPNDLLFVYGTLRSGGYWHKLIDKCEQVATNVTIEGSLYDIGRIPAVTLGGPHKIVGEVYRLPDEETCRTIMSLERGYECSQVNVHGALAWVFHMDVKSKMHFSKPIQSGDWLDYVSRLTINEVQKLG